MRKLSIIAAIVLLVPALVLAMTAVASATSSQLWYLDSLGHPDPDNELPEEMRVMEKAIGDQSGSITIGLGESVYWLAENAAGADVTFPSGAWTITLETDSSWSSNCIVQVGEWDPGNPVGSEWRQIIPNSEVDLSYGNTILVFEIQSGSETIEAGNYLGVKVISAAGGDHTIYTDGRSSCISPNTDPGYPLSEIMTAVMLGGSLACVAGYLLLRRREPHTTVA